MDWIHLDQDRFQGRGLVDMQNFIISKLILNRNTPESLILHRKTERRRIKSGEECKLLRSSSFSFLHPLVTSSFRFKYSPQRPSFQPPSICISRRLKRVSYPYTTNRQNYNFLNINHYFHHCQKISMHFASLS